MATPTPFALTASLTPALIDRLGTPLAALNVSVQGLPNKRAEAGFKAEDAVTLSWVAWSPIAGKGNAVLGSVTQTLTLNCGIAALQLSTRDAVADVLYQYLAGWEITGYPGYFLQFGGAELTPPMPNNPCWMMDVRWGLVVQSRPPSTV